MSFFERYSFAIILFVVMAGIGFYVYHEFIEHENNRSSFEASVGQHFIMGNFQNVANEQSSLTAEDNCSALQPVVIGVLHDILEHLEHGKTTQSYFPSDIFEINAHTLQLFCQKDAK